MVGFFVVVDASLTVIIKLEIGIDFRNLKPKELSCYCSCKDCSMLVSIMINSVFLFSVGSLLRSMDMNCFFARPAELGRVLLSKVTNIFIFMFCYRNMTLVLSPDTIRMREKMRFRIWDSKQQAEFAAGYTDIRKGLVALGAYTSLFASAVGMDL